MPPLPEPLVFREYITRREAEALATASAYPTLAHVRHSVKATTHAVKTDGTFLFLFLKNQVHAETLERASAALARIKWRSAASSNRKCLRQSGGRELHVGWTATPELRQYTPTRDQECSYRELWPLLDTMDHALKAYFPSEWKEQHHGDATWIHDEFPDYKHKWPLQLLTYSAVQLLKSAPTAIHVDAGNVAGGRSVLTTCGNFRGGDPLFLQTGVLVELLPGDVLIAPFHTEFHANLGGIAGTRYSVILFTNEKVVDLVKN